MNDLGKFLTKIEKEYGLTKEDETERYNVIIKNREEYELHLADDILAAIKKGSHKNTLSVELGNAPDWPNEKLDGAIIDIKEGLLLRLKKTGLIQDYQTKVVEEHLPDETGGMSGTPYEYVGATVSVSNILKLEHFLTQFKKERDAIKKVLYRITYDRHTRNILLNGEYVLRKPDFESENEQFFEYMYSKPGMRVPKSEIERSTKRQLKKRIHQILHDLRFKGELLKLFFIASNNGAYFRNPITEEEFGKLGIDSQALKKQLESLPRRSKK